VTLIINYTESNSTVRRLGSEEATLKFRIRDDDYSLYNENGSYYPDGVDALVWTTPNGQNYTNALPCTSTDGHCEVQYNPNCSTSEVGQQYWKSGTNDTCYEYENSSIVSFTVIGQLNVSIITPTTNMILNRNTAVWLNSTVHDDCDAYINDSSVTWYNESWYLINSSYNSTWFVPYNYPLGPDVINVNTSRTYYDQNTNSTNILIYGWAEVDYMIPDNGTVYVSGQPKTIKCHVRDANTLVEINDYNVSFYVDGVWQESELTNESGEEGNVSFVFSTNRPAAWYNLTCRVTSDPSKYYNVTAENLTNEIRISRPLNRPDSHRTVER